MLENPIRDSTGDSARRRPPRRAVRHLLRGLGRHLYLALERARQRRALAALTDALLRDIGLTRRDVEAETGKPFWRG